MAAGESLLSPSDRSADRADAARPVRPGARRSGARVLAALSERERQVLTLVAGGLNNAVAAGALGLSPLTTKTLVSRLMGKLGARDRAQLVIAAYESGMITRSASSPPPSSGAS